MQIKYKIIAVYPETRTIVVRYYTDTVSEEDLVLYKDPDGKIISCKTDVSISIPTPTPEGSNLEALLVKYFPASKFEVIEGTVIVDPMDSIVALKGIETVPAIATKTDAEVKAAAITAFRVTVQSIMDNAAKASGYYNIDTAASYAARDGDFLAEGISFFDWRTNVWKYHNNAVAAYRAGTSALPSGTDLTNAIPSRVLPS